MRYDAAFSNIGCGALIIIVSIPLLKGWVRRNRWYGFRYKKSLESEQNWYAVNNYGAKQLVLWSSLVILIGILSLFLPAGEENEKIAAVLSIAPLLLLIPVIQSYLFARRL